MIEGNTSVISAKYDSEMIVMKV